MARTTANRRMNVSGQHSFANIPNVQMPRSTFDRSCGVKTTFDEAYLVPIFLDEALPGDTMAMKMTSFCRLATPLVPFMDNLKLDVFFFAVPNRLIWEHWQNFMGEEEEPGVMPSYLVPQIRANAWPGGPSSYGQPIGTLWDYFGLPVYSVEPDDPTPGPSVCAFWHRAYNLIFSEWFRDENLVDRPALNKDDGPDTMADYPLLKRGKRKDYITASLPWPQKGPAVELPLGTDAPLYGTGIIASYGDGQPRFDVESGGTNAGLDFNGSAGLILSGPPSGSANADVTWNDPKLQLDFSEGYADLSGATAATINQLREAFQIQRMYERDARGGTRYVEILRSHFRITNHPDARLQRPEYLGGGTLNISLQPVPQTSSNSADANVQGQLAAYGVAAGTHCQWSHSFVEHCVVMGLVNVRADLNYQNNVPRMFSRESRFDFYFPALAHLGEQAVLNKEVFWAWETAQKASNDDVWGYQERWAEYRYKPSQITGLMRSNYHLHSTSIDFWHLAQDFGDVGANRPTLNDEFITEDPPVERVIAVPSEPHFLYDGFFDFKCTRPMPTYSVPGLIDHF